MTEQYNHMVGRTLPENHQEVGHDLLVPPGRRRVHDQRPVDDLIAIPGGRGVEEILKPEWPGGVGQRLAPTRIPLPERPLDYSGHLLVNRTYFRDRQPLGVGGLCRCRTG